MADPFVSPIAQSVIDWSSYSVLAQQVLGTSITKSLDKAGMKANDLSAFLVTLQEIKGDVENPLTLLRRAGSLLRHVSISFLVVAETAVLSELREETTLFITSGETTKSSVDLAVVSGNLSDWRTAIIDCCSDRVSRELRSIAGKCMMFFEKAGLGPIWSEFKRTSMHDQTFKLTLKAK